MATASTSRTDQKRAAGRAAHKASTPALKKPRTSSISQPAPLPLLQQQQHAHTSVPRAQSPAIDSPVAEKKAVRLPAKVSDNRPLPTLPEPQALPLSHDDYQSLAASAVLATSLSRSRLRWVNSGLLERHWVKPEVGKNAKLPPPNNPDVKSMKLRGECRIRIEPHLFVADLYVEEKQKQPPSQLKNYQSGYGQPQRPQQSHTQQNRALPANNCHAAPLPQVQQRALAAPPPPALAHSSASPQPGLTSSPDPVISMLATRASSDPELKSLMKEVATGNATPEQLKIFQCHIDELTRIIQKQKQDADDAAVTAQRVNVIKYETPADTKSATLQPIQPVQQQTRPISYSTQQNSPQVYTQQQPCTAATPTAPLANPPVILAFKETGATEDRFLFPQHSILESLSPQHLLVSFMVTRKADAADDTIGLELDKEYWQPITMMIEVAYGREELLNCIRRWVKPADDVRKHMEDTMQRCQRSPDSHLALRLPFKGAAMMGSEDVSQEEEKIKPKSAAARHARKAAPASTPKTEGNPSEVPGSHGAIKAESVVPSGAETAEGTEDIVVVSRTISTPDEGGGTDEPIAADSSRPKRKRKSVRISEGGM